MNCAIIGAGQLGSRHLQGILKFEKQVVNVYVIDPQPEALEIAQIRAQEVDHQHKIYYCSTIQSLPEHLEMVIIATSAKVRFSVLESLVRHAKVDYLILEKVLFTQIQNYQKAIQLLHSQNIKCWVNHPRRLFPSSFAIKELLANSKQISFQVFGSSWGLACNALHFIDFFEYLTGSCLTKLTCALLDDTAVNSKRSGYIEFNGHISGLLDDSHILTISSISSSELVAPTISILTENIKIIVDEGKNTMYIIDPSNPNNCITEKSIQSPFQSQLTGDLLSEIIQFGDCNLPTLDHAARTHQLFITQLLNHWNSVTGMNHSELPIT